MTLFDWEQRKLGDLTKRVKSYPISHNDEMDSITGTKYIHYGDIHTRKFTRIENDGLLPNIIDHNYISLENGDVVVADASEDYKGIADACIVDRSKSNYKIIAGLHTIAFRPNNKLKANFLYNYFSTSIFKHYGYKMGTGLKVFGITYNNLANMIIKIPDIQEQTKINEILNTITKLLSLQQRKLEGFMTIKAELLRSIFPNKVGKRDINFSDQMWKIQIMNDIFKEKNIKNEHGTLLSVSISKGIYPFSENERKNNSSNNKSNYKEVKYNDIAYNSMRMWQGALGVSEYDGIVSPAYTVITAKKQENPLFYYYYFKNKRMLFNFRQHSQGLTSDTWNLKFPLFKKIVIQTPISKKEEQIIANLFKTLDQNIVSTKMKIKKFNYIKQFFLQNMFI